MSIYCTSSKAGSVHPFPQVSATCQWSQLQATNWLGSMLAEYPMDVVDAFRVTRSMCAKNAVAALMKVFPAITTK
jgi:hypothetical protein